MQATHEQLQKKNQELIDLYRDKSKRHAQTTNLYNLLKSRAMKSQIQTAASDTISHKIQSLGASKPTTYKDSNQQRPFTSFGTSPRNNQYGQYPTGQNDVERLHRNQRSGSGNSANNGFYNITAMPPPHHSPGAVASSFRSRKLLVNAGR